MSRFQLRQFSSPAGEPHVYVVGGHGTAFPGAFNTDGAAVAEVAYRGGGWWAFAEQISIACEIPAHCHVQALLERLEDLSKECPLVLVVRGAALLLADIGIELLSFAAHWEAFVRHSSGVSDMYLVLDVGQEGEPAVA